MKEVGTGTTKRHPHRMETSTNLSSWGMSRAVRIPKGMCETTGIGVGSKLKVIAGADKDGAYILIRPAERHRSFGDAPFAPIDELFAGYTGDYQPSESGWGQDVGDEAIQ